MREKEGKLRNAKKLCWNFSPFALFILSTYVDDEDRRSLLIPSQIHEFVQGGAKHTITPQPLCIIREAAAEESS